MIYVNSTSNVQPAAPELYSFEDYIPRERLNPALSHPNLTDIPLHSGHSPSQSYEDSSLLSVSPPKSCHVISRRASCEKENICIDICLDK